MLYAIAAMFFVKVDDNFSIAVGSKDMPPRRQLLTQVGMIVNLTVEYDPKCPILVAERLMSMRKIDDAEAAHGQADIASCIDPLIIRTSMEHRATHPSQKIGIDLLAAIEFQNACDSTHR